MISFLALLVPFLFSSASAVTVSGPVGSLNIVNKVIAPDGFNRSAVLVNGTYPAPLITANKGDTIRMNVLDRLTDDTLNRATSIHWHGMFQKTTNYADGTSEVSQCPISPNNDFLYEFGTNNQTGTYWYHSHYSNQYCDGLRGPLVIYDPQDPHKDLYDVDDESTIITLSEWYHVLSTQVVGIATADATLINGKGRYFGGPNVDLAVVNVVQGKRYRFRLISMSCEPNFIFSIDGHSLIVIEADGENTHPLTVDSIQIFAAQRYSFILHANQPIDNYWIRSLPNFGNNLTNFDNGINSAILRYSGACEDDEPTSQPQATPELLDESKLCPLTNPQAPGKPYPGGADININLALSVDLETLRFFINGASYTPPTVPVLLQIVSGTQRAQDLLPSGSIYALPKNKVVEVSIPSGGLIGGEHPFHLHGHSFSVIKSAGNDTEYNFDSPVRRDVVSIGDAGSNVTIRFTTDNPGPWFMHCHIVFHQNAGLAVVFAEDTEDTKKIDPTPTDWDNLCPIFDSLPASATEISNATSTTA